MIRKFDFCDTPTSNDNNKDIDVSSNDDNIQIQDINIEKFPSLSTSSLISFSLRSWPVFVERARVIPQKRGPKHAQTLPI